MKFNHSLQLLPVFLMFMAMLVVAPTANAAYVAPKIGGGQVTMMAAPMIHADLFFDGSDLTIDFHPDLYAPVVLRPLTSPDAFDPAAIYYSALDGKAYNWQYAWNPDPAFNPALIPTGAAFWVERISTTPGLRAYYKDAGWGEIFVNDGDIWKWTGGMVHNAYTAAPGIATYNATYRVYLGDALTGAALNGYGDAQVTWTFQSIPEPASMALLAGGAMLAGLRRRGRQG